MRWIILLLKLLSSLPSLLSWLERISSSVKSDLPLKDQKHNNVKFYSFQWKSSAIPRWLCNHTRTLPSWEVEEEQLYLSHSTGVDILEL